MESRKVFKNLSYERTKSYIKRESLAHILDKLILLNIRERQKRRTLTVLQIIKTQT